jgi:hypothetical protein
MQWWNDIVAWFNSTAGMRIVLSVILPFVAIIVAGLIAAAIGRGSAQRVIDRGDRELKGAAITALILVGRKAAIWSSLGADEKQHIDSLMSEADIRVRLLPVAGAGSAADWAAHELADMKKNSASFSFQADQTLVDYRDRLLDWQAKPGRARKLFISDLEQWRYSDDAVLTPASAAHEWTPDPVLPDLAEPETPTALPAVATSTQSGVPTVTPGLATAPPPTTTALDAPAPEGVNPDGSAQPADDTSEAGEIEDADEIQKPDEIDE